MEFKPRDIVIVRPGHEARSSKYYIKMGCYTIREVSFCQTIVGLVEVTVSHDAYKYIGPTYESYRFIKVNPMALTKLEKVLYGIKT